MQNSKLLQQRVSEKTLARPQKSMSVYVFMYVFI